MTSEHHRAGNASSRPNLLLTYFIVQKCFVKLKKQNISHVKYTSIFLTKHTVSLPAYIHRVSLSAIYHKGILELTGISPVANTQKLQSRGGKPQMRGSCPCCDSQKHGTSVLQAKFTALKPKLVTAIVIYGVTNRGFKDNAAHFQRASVSHATLTVLTVRTTTVYFNFTSTWAYSAGTAATGTTKISMSQQMAGGVAGRETVLNWFQAGSNCHITQTCESFCNPQCNSI